MNRGRYRRRQALLIGFFLLILGVVLYRVQVGYIKGVANQWADVSGTTSMEDFEEKRERLEALDIETEMYQLIEGKWERVQTSSRDHLKVVPFEAPPLGSEILQRDRKTSGYILSYHLGMAEQFFIIRQWLPSALLTGYIQQYWQASLTLLALFALAFYTVYRLFTRSVLRSITELNQSLIYDVPPKKLYTSYPSLNELGKTVFALNKQYSQQASDAKANEEKLALLVEHLNLGVLLIEQQKIRLYNSAAENLLGLKEGIAGTPFESTILSNVLIERIRQVMKQGEAWTGHLDVFVPQAKSLDVMIVPFTDQGEGGPESVLVLLYDMTHLHYLEKVRSDFVSNASHELRTPITAIKGFCETLLEDGMADPEMSRSFIEIIAQESTRLEALVHDILQLSKVEAESLPAPGETLDLYEVAQDLYPLFQASLKVKDLSLELIKPEQPIYLTANRYIMDQVLINLIENAIKYSDSKGKITLRFWEEGEEIALSIQDEGIGIPAADLGRIFERFYRVDKARSRKSGGTGLGLSIVRNLVEQMGGRITVTSQLQQGSTFTLHFPKP